MLFQGRLYKFYQRDYKNSKNSKTKNIRKSNIDWSTKVHTNWAGFMVSLENKSEYADFLSSEIKLQSYEKEVVYRGTGSVVFQEISLMLVNSAQIRKSDTRLILHAIVSNYKYIVISSRDTDDLTLLLTHLHKTNCKELWINTETSQNVYSCTWDSKVYICAKMY